MHISRVRIRGFRSSAESEIVCDFPGRFALLVGANNSGKTTVLDALYHAHRYRFPRLRRPSAAVLGPTPRYVRVESSFGDAGEIAETFGHSLQSQSLPPPSWEREFQRSMGQVAVRRGAAIDPDGLENLRAIYLPAHRNPIDELAHREAQILVELLRAEQQQAKGHRNLVDVRNRAASLLDQLTQADLIVSVERRIKSHLSALSAGVSDQHAFVGGQNIDDAYLARVLELMIGAVDERATAQRLELSGLGYVNLLHIAVTLAAIPDTSGGGGQSGLGTDLDDVVGAVPGELAPEPINVDGGGTAIEEGEQEGAADDVLDQAEAEAESDQDAFFPDMFHVTVVVEEPEAHLHPQLQYGLVRYLRKMTQARPELQLIISSHSGEIISACDPTEVVVMRQSPSGDRRAIPVDRIPFDDRDRTLRMARLHLDATRSGSLFSDRMVLVEGVTDAIVLRQLGIVWAGDDAHRRSFVDALTITVMGTKVGKWPVDLLATPDHEIVEKLAILRDSDTRTGPPPGLPTWITARDPVVRAFVSHPTLEPCLVPGNEDAMAASLGALGIEINEISAASIDQAFGTGPHRRRKAELALEFAGELEERRKDGGHVTIPDHIQELFHFLFEGTGEAEDPAEPLDTGQEDSEE